MSYGALIHSTEVSTALDESRNSILSVTKAKVNCTRNSKGSESICVLTEHRSLEGFITALTAINAR